MRDELGYTLVMKDNPRDTNVETESHNREYDGMTRGSSTDGGSVKHKIINNKK